MADHSNLSTPNRGGDINPEEVQPECKDASQPKEKKNKAKFIHLLKKYLRDRKSSVFYDQIYQQLPFDFFF